MLKNPEAIAYGVNKAKEYSREHGIQIGEVVAHESDKLAYYLKETRGNIAIVWLGTEGEEKTFPLDEIFDVNVADRFAMEWEAISMRASEGLEKMDNYTNN